MKPLTIVCAASLAAGEEAFSTLGHVISAPEEAINRDILRGADALVTRSKTMIDETLLEGTSIRFYGTATSGTDHVDVNALNKRGIYWASAPGSNANSVAEYVMAALARIGRDTSISWRGKTLGIIGAGHVGSRLARMAEALGLNILMNDPPLREKTGNRMYRPLDDVLAAADVVSLHVPLTREGPHPTWKMANQHFFRLMKPGATLINTSRGEIMDEPAMLEAHQTGQVSRLILDVFDHEPDVSIEVIRTAAIATPHIAGYSLDARIRGTEMVYRAACEFFRHPARWTMPKSPQRVQLAVNPRLIDPQTLHHLILDAYNPMEDDRRFRSLPVGMTMRTYFTGLRKNYPERREFSHFSVELSSHQPEIVHLCKLLGFVISVQPSTR